MRINKCRHNVVFIIWFSRIHIHSGDFIITFDSLWFPTIVESRSFDVPAQKFVCTLVFGPGCVQHPSGVFQPLVEYQHEVDLHLLFEDSSFPLDASMKPCPLVSRFLPLVGGRVDLWVTSTLSDTFTMGTFYFVTPIYLVNATGRLFAILCKLIIFWTSSSDSFVRGPKD